jgi:hypothetical protein
VAERLHVTRGYRPREQVDLPPGVVDVELARDAVPRGLEQVRERVADRRMPPGHDVDRTCRVRGDEFDVDRLARRGLGFAEALPLGGRPAHDVGKPRLSKPEVQESGPGYLHAGDEAGRIDSIGYRLSDLARVRSLAGRGQGDVRGPVAVLPPSRPLERDGGDPVERDRSIRLRSFERSADEIF